MTSRLRRRTGSPLPRIGLAVAAVATLLASQTMTQSASAAGPAPRYLDYTAAAASTDQCALPLSSRYRRMGMPSLRRGPADPGGRHL
jgi:hypothetical protein